MGIIWPGSFFNLLQNNMTHYTVNMHIVSSLHMGYRKLVQRQIFDYKQVANSLLISTIVLKLRKQQAASIIATKQQ